MSSIIILLGQKYMVFYETKEEKRFLRVAEEQLVNISIE
jgi:hypothetical protein